MSGALLLGFAEWHDTRRPQLESAMPSLIEKQQKQIAMPQHEIPTLQEITARKWSKAEELERLKQGWGIGSSGLTRHSREAERPQSEVPGRRKYCQGCLNVFIDLTFCLSGRDDRAGFPVFKKYIYYQ